MDNELKQLDQIVARRETFDALVRWVDTGNVNYSMLPRPLEYGLLILDEQEYVLFDRNDQVVRFAWYRSDEPFAKFEFDLQTHRLDNIGTVQPMEPSEDVYKPFFYIVSAYIGAMAFIISYIRNEQAVIVKRDGSQHIYQLEHQCVELHEMTISDSIIGQLTHFLNIGGNWNR